MTTPYETLLNEQGCCVIIIRGWASKAFSDHLLELGRRVCTQQLPIMMYGKQLLQPRYNCAFADPHITEHRYSGSSVPTATWDIDIRQIRDALYSQFGFYADSCLVNGYADGHHNIGWHADKETADPKKMVATLSTGATRRFLYRWKSDHSKKIETRLHHGDLVLMYGETNRLLEHSIPKELKVKEDRYSFTLRVLSETTLKMLEEGRLPSVRSSETASSS